MGPSSLPVVLVQPDESHANGTILCWNDKIGVKHNVSYEWRSVFNFPNWRHS